jgi:hypothetical protein
MASIFRAKAQKAQKNNNYFIPAHDCMEKVRQEACREAGLGHAGGIQGSTPQSSADSAGNRPPALEQPGNKNTTRLIKTPLML